MQSLSRRIPFITVVCAMLLLPCGSAFGEEGWRADFDAACANTTDAMGLSVQQLSALLEKCDRVQKAVEQQDETARKVYLKRLQMCRNLYAYVLDFKKNAQGGQ